jgi:nucleoside-diphosphate-sugar epimerase
MADEEEEVVPKKPVFVVGASGFVGSEVSKAFVNAEDEEGWEVSGTLRAGTSKPKWVSHVVQVGARPASSRCARREPEAEPILPL